ncbi:hypothetical protein QBC34DRAFT_391774 [Podospora aff. communis PSN243]|uniref:Protein kinase domain-containing protein n=1 Tax=Podospora aff. communis PSN243 TaxID=3040156 RepID=A0AAV9H5I2_9PEZI|nr:hypothetical protein QBC34DRAFT_391774 [Podospora aff. communis PSN243]
MDLTSDIFVHILSPLAAFTSRQTPRCEGSGRLREGQGALDDDRRWGASFLNPQSRIDSLTPSCQPTWRVDGVDVDGRRIFAIPTLGVGKPPLRIDVYLPPLEDYPGQLRDILRPEALLRESRGAAVAMSPVVQHLLRALEHWASQMPDFESQYLNMPYGSSILVTSITASLESMSADIHMCPSYDVEQAMQTVDSLHSMWNLPDAAWPPILEWEDLQFQKQLHESITLVTLADKAVQGTEAFVFKSLTRDQRYMYNELRMLLTLPPHPNIISRPVYAVTKRARFGGKRGICGFLIEHFSLGSLKQHLYDADVGAAPQITQEEQFRWSEQIISALVHVNKHPDGFYPDLKPDNVVLRPSGKDPGHLDAVLLDLEQRGGWYSWSPPEVAFVEYLEVLVSGLEDAHEEVRGELEALLEAKIPGWRPGSQQDRYRNSPGGFSAPWLRLLERRKQQGDLGLEKAQVFMLGKLLWCIFEETPLIRCGIDHELLQDNRGPAAMRLRFPEFKRTPQELRDLVRRCTQGAPEWEEGRMTNVLELRKGKLVGRDGRDAEDVAGEYWAGEIERAKKFLEGGHGALLSNGETAGCSLRERIARRPTFFEVQRELARVKNVLGGNRVSPGG